MSKNFWQKLKKPFIAMAPMAEVTTPVFRQIVAKIGKPDVIFTEFVACDGIASEKGRIKLLPKLKFTKKERPIVAQFFGSRPENFIIAAKLARKMGFDGIDINMGCPSKKIEKQGAGANLIKNPELARKVILATKKGAEDLPVSVKTRLGYDKNSAEDWIKAIAEAGPAAIAIHGRLQKEGRRNTSDWNSIGKAGEIARKINPEIIIIGNGDIKTKAEGLEKAKKYNLDGVMIGRAALANPWMFSRNPDPEKIGLEKRITAAKTHLRLMQKESPSRFDAAKKFLKAYFSDFKGSQEIKTRLMASQNWEEAFKILKSLI